MPKSHDDPTFQPLKRYLAISHNNQQYYEKKSLNMWHNSTDTNPQENSSPLARWIMHIDMDAFFASVEIKMRPELKEKPVCVGPDPKKGKGRGVVRAASYEARSFGIRSGMPISLAYKLCPKAIFVSGDFSNYGKSSEEIMSILAEYADGGFVKQASIDEAYIEVTKKVQQYAHPTELAREIQKKIDERVQLPCSIGIAPNISVAKIATSMNKPRGITFVTQDPEEVANFLAPLKVKMLNGVGRVTAERLQKYGVETLGQIQQMKFAQLYSIMGSQTQWIRKRALGIDERPLVASGSYIHRSISKEHTFGTDIEPQAMEIIYQTLERICNEITDKLKVKNMVFRTVTLKLRYQDFTTIQRSKSFSVTLNNRKTLLRTIINLFKENQASKQKIRLVGVKISNLHKIQIQRNLDEFF